MVDLPARDMFKIARSVFFCVFFLFLQIHLFWGRSFLMSWTAKRWIRTRVCWKNAVSVRGSFVSIALPSMKPDAQNQRQGSRPLGAAHKSGVGMCRWCPFHIHNPQKVKIDDRLFGQFGWDDYHHPSKEYCLLPKRYIVYIFLDFVNATTSTDHP